MPKSSEPITPSLGATRIDGLVPTLPAQRLEYPGGPAGPGKIGRFVVLRKLGEGGMGVVYAAYDEELERKVAIKLLRGGFSGKQQTLGQARLLREAQAMAKLSHPNVAQIYEVGQIGDAVFIAMEFISGSNLSEWLRDREQPWRAILGAYLQAGQGLAAAHAAGLVHRDFKPDNVLMGDDARVRVVDFGLARPDDITLESPDPASTLTSGPKLTQMGTLIGTPAYMAPEQLRRDPADALSDQFSFCIALFESLYGHRPFKGETPEELLSSVTGEVRVDPPRDTEVPAWIHQLLVRGLSLEPERRFPAMDALLQALAADPAVARRRRLGIAGLVLMTGLVLSTGAYALLQARAHEAARCGGARERLAAVWDPGVSATVRAAIASTGVSYADDVATRVDAQLTGYADAWADMHGSACEARRQGEQSDALYDLRMTCLDDRKTALRALVEVLSAADATVVERALQAVERLPRVARCADTRALLATSPPPDDPAVAEAVGALETELATAQAMFSVGQHRTAHALAEGLRARAEALDYAPSIAAVLHLSGVLADALGEYASAEAILLRAVAVADRARDDDRRAGATIDLVRVVGLRQARFDEALRFAELARGAAARLPDGRQAEANLEVRLSELALQRGDLAQADLHIGRSVDLHAQLHGDDSTAFATAIDARASLNFLRGDFDAALVGYRQVLAIYERAYGSGHPLIGHVLNNVGAVELTLFRYPEAEATYTRTLEILRGTYGASHPAIATVYSNLGFIAFGQARFEPALEHFRRSLALYEAHLPPNHPNIGDCLSDLAHALLVAGRPAEAEQEFARALAVYRMSFGIGHPKTTQGLTNLGAAQLADGRATLADETFKIALAEFKGDPADPALAGALAGIGRLHLDAGRFDEAVLRLEDAAARLSNDPAAAPHEIAATQFALARALYKQDPANTRRCRELAGEARAGFGRVGAAFDGPVADIDAWLARLPAP